MAAEMPQLARRGPLVRTVAWLALAFLFLPMLVVVPVSLTDQTYLSMPQEALSLQHYRRVFTDPTWLSAIAQTTFVATVSALLATVIGGLAALAAARAGDWRASAIRALALMPLIVPTIVSGLGFYRSWAWLGLLDSYTGVVLAFTITATPYVFTTVGASLSLFDLRLEQAARNLGAGPVRAIWAVVLPAVLPGALSGFLFAFVYVWDEVVILLFITGRNVRLLQRLLLQGLQDNIDPTIAVFATVLIALTATAVLLAGTLGRQAPVAR